MSDDAGGATGRGTATTPRRPRCRLADAQHEHGDAPRPCRARLGHGLDVHVRDGLGRGRLADGVPQNLTHPPRREGVSAHSLPRVQHEAAEVLRGL